MAFFDKLDSLKDKAVDLAQSGAAKSKELAEIGKLKLNNAAEEDAIKKAYIEIGKPYYWLVWICTSLATFLLSPGKQLWILYLAIFGIYPILKAFFERIKNRSVWLVLKLVYINIILVAFTLVWEFVFSVPLFVFDNKLFVAIAYAVVNVGFIAYDAFISVMVRLYFVKLRPRFKGLLK